VSHHAKRHPQPIKGLEGCRATPTPDHLIYEGRTLTAPPLLALGGIIHISGGTRKPPLSRQQYSAYVSYVNRYDL
jgi:hypothetical protein